MVNRLFGKFLKALRQQKHYFDEDQNYRQWTQQFLATKSRLSVRQISRLEQGDGPDFSSYLSNIGSIAQALGLNEREKEQFFSKAGFSYPTTEKEIDVTRLKELFNQLHFPASARTKLWDFVAFNTYHYQLYGYTQETLTTLQDKSVIGANLLRVIFDPQFRKHNVKRVNTSFEGVIRAFRMSSFKHADTRRYQEIIAEMKQFPVFERTWRMFELSMSNEMTQPFRLPISILSHPKYGTLEMLSLRIPQRYIGYDIDVIIYTPLLTSVDNYQRLVEDVKLNTVYQFPYTPIS